MKLVKNWKSLYRTWTVKLATAGLIAPEVLQLIADNTDKVPKLSLEDENTLRLICLCLIIVFRHVNQNIDENRTEKSTP